MLVFRWVDTGESRLEVLETTGGYDVEAFLPSTGEKARLVLIYLSGWPRLDGKADGDGA